MKYPRYVLLFLIIPAGLYSAGFPESLIPERPEIWIPLITFIAWLLVIFKVIIPLVIRSAKKERNRMNEMASGMGLYYHEGWDILVDRAGISTLPKPCA